MSFIFLRSGAAMTNDEKRNDINKGINNPHYPTQTYEGMTAQQNARKNLEMASAPWPVQKPIIRDPIVSTARLPLKNEGIRNQKQDYTPAESEERSRGLVAMIVTASAAWLIYRCGIRMEWYWWAGGFVVISMILDSMAKKNQAIRGTLKLIIFAELIGLCVFVYNSATSSREAAAIKSPVASQDLHALSPSVTKEPAPQGSLDAQQK
jgi:hypothetical protein